MHFLYLFYWLARSLGLGVGVLHILKLSRSLEEEEVKQIRRLLKIKPDTSVFVCAKKTISARLWFCT